MYICPLCEKKYPPDQVPETCVQCKRPLILNKRWRIEISVQTGPYGEDFDVTDLKSGDSVILRELRIKKRDLAQRQSDVDRYEENKDRLSGTKYDGNPVLLDDFTVETKNSQCFYLVFDADAWAILGDELYLGSGAGQEEELPPVEGRDLDPELAAMLAKLPSDEGKKEKGGAMVKADGDKPPVKASGDGAIATRSKLVIGVSALVLIIAGVVAALMLL